MSAMTNLYIPVCGFFCAVLLLILFFAKKRAKNNETKLFSGMIITSFIDSLLMISIITIAYLSKESIQILEILNKFDFLQFLLWIWFLFLYVVYISYKEESSIINYRLIERCTGIANIIFTFLIFILPVEIYNQDNIMYSYGASCNFLYAACSIYVFLILLTMVVNYKKVFTKKYIPLFTFVALAILVLIVRNINPGLVIVTAAIAYTNLIMYFTIENPDLKVINALEVAKEAAIKANNAKTDFLSSMSHEIRTPLNAIMGFSEAIENANTLEEAKENSKDVIEASRTLLDIVNGILDISKIEAGKLEIINSAYKAKDMFENLAKLIRPRIEEKAIEFDVHIAEDIPQVLYGDYANIKKVVTNILTNAAKYTDTGKITYNVECVKNNDICRLIISVEDTGRGIRKENIDKLFKKFERLDEKNTTIEGTGLGLAITKQIVELMGGEIIVQSVYGSGSKFTILLNQRIEKIDTIELESSLKREITFTLSGKKILVVDDNKLNLKVASKVLENYNPILDLVESGQHAIDKILNNEKYDLILMDDMMPKLSGTETLNKLKEIKDFDIPVIVLTANAISGMRESYIEKGFNDYLAKPINRQELEDVLGNILNPTPEGRKDKFEPLPSELFEMDKPLSEMNLSENSKVVEMDDNSKIEFLKGKNVDIENSLELLGDLETYNETIKTFYDEIEKRKETLTKYIETKDLENYRILVHAIKSDSKYLGFTKLSEIAFNHEQESKNFNYDYVYDDFDNLINTIDEVIKIVDEYIKLSVF